MIDKKITQVILVQIGLTVCIAVPCGLTLGVEWGLSAASGGAVGFLSALAYALRASQAKGDTPQDWLAAQYAGERFKFFVTVALIVAIAKAYPPLHWLVFLLSFMATMAAYFFALLWKVK